MCGHVSHQPATTTTSAWILASTAPRPNRFAMASAVTSVALARPEASRISISVGLKNQRHQICVIELGNRPREDVIERQPRRIRFAAIDQPTRKEPGKGTGLGLSAVFGIVQQCRGT